MDPLFSGLSLNWEDCYGVPEESRLSTESTEADDDDFYKNIFQNLDWRLSPDLTIDTFYEEEEALPPPPPLEAKKRARRQIDMIIGETPSKAVTLSLSGASSSKTLESLMLRDMLLGVCVVLKKGQKLNLESRSKITVAGENLLRLGQEIVAESDQ